MLSWFHRFAEGLRPAISACADVEIICLAISRKRGGRCLAGARKDGGGWVRPVAQEGDGALHPRHCCLPDGSEPRVGEVLSVSLVAPAPKPHQSENWLIAGGWRTLWQPPRRAVPRGVAALEASLAPGPALLGSILGSHDETAFSADPAQASLALVQPDDLRWRVFTAAGSKSKVQVVFRLSDARYDLALTDLVWEERLRALPPGWYGASSVGLGAGDRVLLTVSLGEPWNGRCHKLVAAIVTL